jgi:hypothetical protein
MQELLPKEKQTMVGTILQLNNGVVAIYCVIYYWFISSWWIPIQVFGGVLTFVSAAGVWFLPESPKFLLTKKRYDETRAAINFIAKWNNQKPFNGKFDREILDLKESRDPSINDKSHSNSVQNETDIATPIQDRAKIVKTVSDEAMEEA